MRKVITILLIYSGFAGNLSGQDIKGQEIMLRDTSLASSYNSDLFRFPNVNKIPFYRSDKTLKNIQSLDRQKRWEELYPVLFDYVSNFGVVNFYTDTYLIWRLAKLTELYGDFDEAKKLYRLVLKHNSDDIDINTVELYYDSITKNEQIYYVPVEYYYELVDYSREVDTWRPPRGVLLSSGTLVNSKYADYGPVLNGDDGLLVFTSKETFQTGLGGRSKDDFYF